MHLLILIRLSFVSWGNNLKGIRFRSRSILLSLSRPVSELVFVLEPCVKLFFIFLLVKQLLRLEIKQPFPLVLKYGDEVLRFFHARPAEVQVVVFQREHRMMSQEAIDYFAVILLRAVNWCFSDEDRNWVLAVFVNWVNNNAVFNSLAVDYAEHLG